MDEGEGEDEDERRTRQETKEATATEGGSGLSDLIRDSTLSPG